MGGSRYRHARWVRPVAAALLALLLLLVGLYALDAAGGRVRSADGWAAVAVTLIAGAIAA